MRMPDGSISTRQLVVLVATAETGSLSAAAGQLGCTQSAVSQQISAVERILDVRLFLRPGGSRSVRLTPSGEVMLHHARAILARLDAAAADARAVAKGNVGPVRVGTFQSAASKVVPPMLQRFRTAWPDIEFRLFESNNLEELAGKVMTGDLDLAFTQLPAPAGPFEIRWLLDDPFLFFTAADGPQASRSSISVDEIVTLQLIGVRQPTFQSRIARRLNEGRVAARFVFLSDDIPTIHALVASGFGHAVLPLLSADPNDSSVIAVPIQPPVQPRRIGLIWHTDRELPDPVTWLIVEAEKVCRSLYSKALHDVPIAAD
jgi:DNA-binding transcriptional LysR family regulator